MIWDVTLETLVDALKMLPILYLAYLLMEFLEHKAGSKMEQFFLKAGKTGPLLGALLGLVPQCGFSGAMAGLYAGGIISAGTLIAVFMATSDEMLPLLISSGTALPELLKLLGMKAVGGLVFGYLIDLIFPFRPENDIEEICEQDHCDCHGHSIFLSALIHTAKIWALILVITFAINLVFELGAGDYLREHLPNTPFIMEASAALLGLVPSCSVSVLFTEMYLSGLISVGTLMAGLYTNAGVGLLVLLRQHRDAKDNLRIVILLYLSGLIGGLVISALF